ncbi:MAG: DUF3489 domain-containing protein [Magnetococcales bacterium]|nr:DUF3489 domain-containing protein [Magnetococcales bacterium]
MDNDDEPRLTKLEAIRIIANAYGIDNDHFAKVVNEALEHAFRLGRDSMARKTKPAKPARQPTAPKTPRADSKQARVIAMMQRPEGATLAQIAEATGWQNHTIRAFISTSKKKGLEIASNHLRVVGPNQPGSPGSVTSYCIG